MTNLYNTDSKQPQILETDDSWCCSQQDWKQKCRPQMSTERTSLVLSGAILYKEPVNCDGLNYRWILLFYVKLERPSLNSGGGLRHYSTPTYNAVLSSLPGQVNNYSHLSSPSPNIPHGPENLHQLGVYYHIIFVFLSTVPCKLWDWSQR